MEIFFIPELQFEGASRRDPGADRGEKGERLARLPRLSPLDRQLVRPRNIVPCKQFGNLVFQKAIGGTDLPVEFHQGTKVINRGLPEIDR